MILGSRSGWEKAELEAFLCPFPCVGTRMSTPCGGVRRAAWTAGCSVSPPHCPVALQRPHSPAVRHLLFYPEGWGHLTPAHHPAKAPRRGRREGRAPKLLDDNPVESSPAAGAFLRDTAAPGLPPPALSQSPWRRRSPLAPGAGGVQQHLPGRASGHRGWDPLKSLEPPPWGEARLSPPRSDPWGKVLIWRHTAWWSKASPLLS